MNKKVLKLLAIFLSFVMIMASWVAAMMIQAVAIQAVSQAQRSK